MTRAEYETTTLPGAERIADHDAASLAATLARRTRTTEERARRAATKALRHAFRRPLVEASCWHDEALRDAGIGKWARPALLELSAEPSVRLIEQVSSADGTIRGLLQAPDGACVEAVLIPSRRATERSRTTLCISSQVGCAYACRFCESGRGGLQRQLTAAEIVDQVRVMGRLWTLPAGRTISNIVFMGMGEPLDNLAAVVRAIRLLTDQNTFGFAPSRITVSTVGIPHQFATFFTATRAELAVSLNAPDDERRRHIMPIAATFDLATLRDALLVALPPRRRVLFQYALFANFNDAVDDADRLAAYVKPICCRVNVIPANPGPDPKLATASTERVNAFAERLYRRGTTVLLRHPRGRDVSGGCGQLAGARRTTERSCL